MFTGASIWRTLAATFFANALLTTVLTWDRNSGWLWTLIVCIPLVIVISSGMLISAFFVTGLDRRVARVLAALAIPISAIAAYEINQHMHDRMAFAFWYPLHARDLQKSLNGNEVLVHWDAWGFAGMSNDLYLVSNPSDNISDYATLGKWARDLKLPCRPFNPQRMRRGIYLITTSDCSFERP